MTQEIVNAVKDVVGSMISDVHTSMPAKILSYDPDKSLAVVSPIALFKKPDGTTMPYPDITGVPVVFPQSYGQKATIAYPVCEGDGCLLIVSEQSLEYWLFGMETDASLGHDITNGIAIVGMFTAGNAVMKKACSENAIIVDVEGSYVYVNADKIKVEAPTVEVVAKDKISMTAPTVDITANVNIIGNKSISGNVVCGGSCNKECKC